jgi:hypothetical protein
MYNIIFSYYKIKVFLQNKRFSLPNEMRHNCKTTPKRHVVSAEKDFILINEEIMRGFPRLDEVN